MLSGLLASTDSGLRLGVVLTTFGFGLRHGIDWDHIAALTDLTSSQPTPRRSMQLASLYAAGHGLVVFVLGLAAIVFAAQLPSSLDASMERLVGVTLLLLGVYVLYGLIRYRGQFQMRSRWMLVFAAVRRLMQRQRRSNIVVIDHEHDHPAMHRHHVDAHQRLPVPAGLSMVATHRHGHRHIAAMPVDPFVAYSEATSFGVGMLHGVGAETPTQILLFLTAASVGGRAAGVALLLCFLAGLLASNTIVALTATFGFLRARANSVAYMAVSATIGLASLVLGAIFMFGQGNVLPVIFSH